MHTTSDRLTAQEITELVAEGRMVLVDVRERAEVQASGKATPARHIPLSILSLKADPRAPDRDPSLKTDVPVALYCAAGGRAGRAGEMLRAMGYHEVLNLGGLGDWVAAGGAVSRA